MNAKTALINALTGVGYVSGQTLFLQGTVNPSLSYPAEFVTFWVNYTDDVSFYNNGVSKTAWNVSVILYANSATVVNEKPSTIISALKAAGFIPQGKGQDVLSDEDTHTGWAMEFIYLEH